MEVIVYVGVMGVCGVTGVCGGDRYVEVTGVWGGDRPGGGCQAGQRALCFAAWTVDGCWRTMACAPRAVFHPAEHRGDRQSPRYMISAPFLN